MGKAFFCIWWLLLIATAVTGAWVRFDWRAAALTAISAVCGWYLRETKEIKDEETEDESE